MWPEQLGETRVDSRPCRKAHRPKTQLGSRCCHRLPCRRTSIRSPRLATWPRFLVSAARYARAVRRRRQVSRFAPIGSSCDVPPFAPFRPNHPKAFRPSRFAPPGWPESCPGIASVPLGLIRRPTRASRVGRRGQARSSEESQQPDHRRPTKIVCRSIPSSLCRLGALSISPVARFDEQRSAATRDHSARKLPVRVRNVSYLVRPSRLRAPVGRSGAVVPTSKPPSSPCGSDTFFEDQVLERSSDFSANHSRSRCHHAVTNAESHQARNARRALWITWITCTIDGRPVTKFPMLVSSRIRHAMQPKRRENVTHPALNQTHKEKGKQHA